MAVSKLPNGHVLVALATSSLEFAVTECTLPPLDGGDLPDTTTNDNTTYRSKGSRQFIEIGQFSVTGAFDPDAYTTVVTTINVDDVLTATLVDGRTVAFPVKMKSYTPDSMTEDAFPTAVMEFTPLTGADGSTGITITPAP